MIARVTVILQSIPSQEAEAAAAEHQQFSNFKDREASLAVKNTTYQFNFHIVFWKLRFHIQSKAISEKSHCKLSGGS